jgi:hypothetical protein
MDDFDTCFERALDKPAFSNSDEGLGWLDANCSRCAHDRPARQGRESEGCPLILVAFMERTPAEWLEGDRSSIAGRYTCVMFRHEDDGGDPEPKPIPTPPGQGELFPRAGLEGVRMLKPLPAEVRTEVSA